jgi:decaprenylphospho-beta-D-erythro-pentofuranosid-2-ulose 2-reductase
MKDALGSVRSVLVFGAGSDIAQATVRELVAERTRVITLAARKPERLEPFAEDLRARGALDVRLMEFDADAFASHEAIVRTAFDAGEDIDVVLVAFGVLGDQALAERDGAAAIDVITTNFLGAVSVLIPVAARLREQGHGTIVVVSSVAAERGRRSNYVYGSSKAGLDTFCQGLGDRLQGTGVRVMVVRPGFVRTKMTAGLAPAPMAASPRDVAVRIVQGLRSGADTVWVPPALRWVMSGLRHLPRPVFRRLKI